LTAVLVDAAFFLKRAARIYGHQTPEAAAKQLHRIALSHLNDFARRKAVELAGVHTWITSREDLILSKLVWARDSRSEMQMRDVRTLLDDSVDWTYLRHWAPQLDVTVMLDEAVK
jgi:hypothetical protein